ncbi:MAG: response regulator [Pseudomonadota bacterium]
MSGLKSYAAAIGGETVLVDDAVALLSIAKDMLTQFGCEVLAYDDPIAARDYILSAGDRVKLLITDQSMPTLSGMALIASLDESGVKPYCVLTTGAHEPSRLSEYQARGVDAVLPKPFSLADIESVLIQLTASSGC